MPSYSCGLEQPIWSGCAQPCEKRPYVKLVYESLPWFSSQDGTLGMRFPQKKYSFCVISCAVALPKWFPFHEGIQPEK